MNVLLRIYPGDAWAVLIANVLVQVTVIILTAWLLARLGSRWNAAWRHVVYLVAVICALASPALAWVMQTTGIAMVTLRRPAPSVSPPGPVRISVAHVPESGLSEAAAMPQLAATPQDSLPSSFSDAFRAFATVALVIWLFGMAVLLARWCYGLHLIAVLRRAARPLDGEAMVDLLRQVRRVLGVHQLPPMATSANLERPVMVGLIRPLVILPEDVLRTLHEAQLGDIVVHECAHAVCRHQVVGLFQRVAGVLFWPHPLVHLLNWELARAREEVCDNYVLHRSDALSYARTLLELSQLLVGVSPKPTALGLFHCHWKLEDRVADLLDRRRMVMVRVSRWTTATLTATFLFLALLIAGTRVVQAEPAAKGEVPAPAGSSGLPDRSSPATSLSQANPDEVMAITEVEKLGGKVTINKESPDKSVIGVSLMKTEVTDAGLEQLKRFTQLQRLDLRVTKVTNAGLKHLKGFTQLRTLDLSFTKVSDAGLEQLAGLVNLQWLNLFSTEVTDSGLEHLKGLTKLQTLCLEGTGVTDAGLEHLQGLTNLESLHLYRTEVTDAGLERLKALTELKTLNLGWNPGVTDAGLEHLKSLTNLQSLFLYMTKVTDVGLGKLQRFKKLQRLDLPMTRVTDAGLENLKGLTNLDLLNLDDTEVTDAGLEHLRGLTKLRVLCLRGAEVSDEGVKRLQQALPKCKIER